MPIANPSAQQQAIFAHFKNSRKCLIVRARAGTGKTTTIVEAVTYAPEQKILIAAFNKEIAEELTKRVTDPRVQCKTLHSLGFAFIRQSNRSVTVDSNGQRALDLAKGAAPTAPETIQRLISNLHTKVREIKPFANNVADIAEIAYRFDLLPEASETFWLEDRVFAATLNAVREASRPTNVVDFADMIFLPLVQNLVRPWFNLVVVDEGQDMTEAQLLVAMGACKRDGRIVIVGDDWQAIYGFRGADSGSLDRLKTELRAEELGLTVTYRCPASHVALCQEIVADFVAAPTAIPGVIAKCTREQLFTQVKPGDFVISRTNAPLVEVCLGLLKSGVRATIRGRDIGQGVTSLINKLKAKNVAHLLERLADWASVEISRASARGLKGEARIAYVQAQVELIEALCQDVEAIRDLLDRVYSLFSDDSAARVICTTVHKVKGLETNNTFILTGTLRENSREELAIKYVALSRSKNTMTFVSGFERIKQSAA